MPYMHNKHSKKNASITLKSSSVRPKLYHLSPNLKVNSQVTEKKIFVGGSENCMTLL